MTAPMTVIAWKARSLSQGSLKEVMAQESSQKGVSSGCHLTR